MTADDIIKYYKLQAHPEGGYYTETYRSKGSLDAKLYYPDMEGRRAYSTAIYFLLKNGEKSQLHRLRFDEIFHFYAGDPLDVWMLFPDKSYKKVRMGQNILDGETPQCVIPAYCWFGAIPQGKYSFIGCTLAPGFDFIDFELKDPKQLLNENPDAKEMISLFVE